MARGIVRPARRPAGWHAPGPAPAGPQGRLDLEPAADEDLCYLTGDWRLFQKQQGHRWSLDDLVTAWVATRGIDSRTPLRAMDLGCGLGSVLLMVAWRLPHADVTGIEAQADRAAMGRRSIAYNGVEARCRIVDGDLRELGEIDRGDAAAAGPFDLVTGTPPYFPRGTGVESTKTHAAAARFEHRGGVEDYLRVAKKIVAPGGRIAICSAAIEQQRVAAIAAELRADSSGARTIALVHREHWSIVPRIGKAPLVAVDVFVATAAAAMSSAAMAEADRDAPTPVEQHTLVVRDAVGQWTDDYRRVRSDLGMPATPPRR